MHWCARAAEEMQECTGVLVLQRRCRGEGEDKECKGVAEEMQECTGVLVRTVDSSQVRSIVALDEGRVYSSYVRVALKVVVR